MNFQQLRIVRETVRRHFNLTEVANSLFTSQSGVSKHIKDLEDELGVELFVRRGKRLLGLTDPGKELIAIVERILIDTTNIKRLGEQFSNREQGQLVIATTHTQARYVLPHVVAAFRLAYPKVRLTLVSSTTKLLLDDLANGVIDLMLSTLPATPEAAELLLADQLVWVGGRGGDAHTRTPLPLSLGEETCMFRAVSTKLLAEADRDWRPVCTVGTWEPVHATLVADLAVMPMLRSSVPADLAIIGPEAGLPALPAYNINMHFPATGRSVLAEELAQMIRQEFKSRYGSQRAAEMKARVAA